MTFAQGLFQVDPNATPEQIARKRELIAAMMPQFGKARYIGEGIGQLATGIMGGLQEMSLDKTERENKAKADELFSRAMSRAGEGSSGHLKFPTMQGADASQPMQVPSMDPVAPSNPRDMEKTIYDGLIQRGMPDHIARGAIANKIAESGLRPDINEANPLVAGSRGGFGLNQWTGPRRRELESFAAERGVAPSDLNTQLDFTMKEFQGPESKAWSLLQQTRDPVEAAKVYSESFLRPGIPHMEKRLAEANRLASVDFGRSDVIKPVQVASLGNDIGASGGQMANAIASRVSGLGDMQPQQSQAQPMPKPVQAAQAPAQQMGGGLSTQELYQAMANPWLSKEQKAVISSMIDERSPARALEMQLKQAQINKYNADAEKERRLGLKPKYGLAPQFGIDENGNPVILQVSDEGRVIQSEMPKGVKLGKQGIKVDTGTGTAIVDPITGEVRSVTQKDILGKESAEEVGKMQGKSQAILGSSGLTAQQTISKIDQLLADPNLSKATGFIQGKLPDTVLGLVSGDGAVDARKRAEQLRGAAFLEAYNGLRGGGAITDVEGKKAEDALARLDMAQSDEAYRQALKDFRDAVQVGYRKLEMNAGRAPSQTISPQQPASGGEWQTLPSGVKIRVKQ